MNKNVVSEIVGNTLIVKQICFPTYKFEIRENIPHGYNIWNIGENMPDDYIPYCKYLNDLNIDSTNLIAVKKQ